MKFTKEPWCHYHKTHCHHTNDCRRLKENPDKINIIQEPTFELKTITLNVEINGTPVKALLNTGSSKSFIDDSCSCIQPFNSTQIEPFDAVLTDDTLTKV